MSYVVCARLRGRACLKTYYDRTVQTQRDATVRADLDGAQLNGMHVDPSTLKIKKAPKGSPLRVGDQIFAINGERVEPDGAAGPLAALLRGLDHVSLLATRAPRDPNGDANPFGY